MMEVKSPLNVGANATRKTDAKIEVKAPRQDNYFGRMLFGGLAAGLSV
jgi:hypothetical protein